MSLSAQSHVKTWISQNKRGAWRIVNSTVILFSFFIPWALTDFYSQDTYNGFQLLDFYKDNFIYFVFYFRQTLAGRIRSVAINAPLVLGLISILIYCALNVLATAIQTNWVNTPLWHIVALCLTTLGAVSLPRTIQFSGTPDLPLLLPGYWLLPIALVSSLILEISQWCSAAR